MRWRPWFWLTVSICCFLGALYFWRLGDKWNAEKAPTTSLPSRGETQPAAPARKAAETSKLLAPVRLLSQPGNVNSWPAPSAANSNLPPRLAYRLSNTTASLRQLTRNDHAILLENALLDTAKPTALPIPDYLRAQGDPEAYIVQARGPLDNTFRAALKSVGATVVAYIPNNAYLVRGSEAVAQQLQANPQVQVVLPYEPYYKIKPLDFAVEQKPLPDDAVLNLLLFADAHDATLGALASLGVQVLGEDRSPFGPVVRVLPPLNSLATLAQLTGVQEIEFSHTRITANDLSRAAVGVAADSVTQTNYLGLSGTNVLIAVVDTGVDTNHPDLQGRVMFDVPLSGVDSNGHGTHVAGIIAGDGTKSTTVTNAEGSIMPGVAGQFRGKAPAAKLLSMDFNQPDYYLQETAARTNAVISNNSWTYGVPDYDLAAASYDAAVRDSVPEVTGSQSLVYVFPAGNGGGASVWDDGSNSGGSGGVPGTIQSPGTAKNVITVGAAEMPRNITNQTWLCDSSGANCTTNQPWLPSTDSSNQVASFSSRGNVGIGIEGDFGRFKPDVVAPGTFVVSTRSGQWDEQAYYNPTNYSSQVLPGLQIQSNSTYSSGSFVPGNTVQLVVSAIATTPIVDLPIDVTSPSGTVTHGVNQVSLPPDGALDVTANTWSYTVSNPTPQEVTFLLRVLLVTTNDHGNFLQVLSNMNNSLGGDKYYRYESGTSMAAADAAGSVALIRDYFQRLQVTNSPALMKAMLINGARSLGDAYDYQVQSLINFQGWGQVFIPTTLPASLSNSVTTPTASAAMFVFDQNPTNALATGQSYTRFFKLSAGAQDQPLRVTLAWTDPPGDPLASVKLVNDLDLVVTNLDTGLVYFGNDIVAGNDFNLPWQTNTVPSVDSINNVENVYIKLTDPQEKGTNFSVTVIGHRVNVNAVTANPDNVAQDYALVVSSGDGGVADALTLQANFLNPYVTTPNVVIVTNQFPQDPENPVTGGLLLHQHVGANTPLLGTNTVPFPTDANAVITTGMTNQWHFYVLSNDMNFTNASFVTFMPPNLAVPRMGVTNVDNPDNATRVEADIDMYVSTDFNLTNLDPNAIAAADKSVGRGGTEFVVKSNAAPRGVYYVGVKSEDQQAAEYNFLGVFSLFPPSTTDTNGNVFMRGMPAPSVIPPGTPPGPQAAIVLGLAIQPIHIRRVIVTNTMTHSFPGGLIGTLSHTRKFTVLNNHTCAEDTAGNCITNIHDYIYEDNGEGNVFGSRSSDGPGSLKDFIGEEGLGVWTLTMVNNFPSGTGVVNRLLIELEKQNLDTNGVVATILPDTWHYDSIDVPPDATNLTVCVSGNTLPVGLYISRDSLPTLTASDHSLIVNPPGDCLSVGLFDTPPLQSGRYYIGVFNPNGIPQQVRIVATIYRNPFAVAASISSSAGPITIQDDAVTYAYITNLNHQLISSLDVGLLISDPRISDLAITLISPNGTRVLLFENRGALSTNGLGTFSTITNSLGLPIFGNTNLTAFYTNNFDDVPTGPYAPGAVFDGWNVYSNLVRIYPELPAPWLSNNVLVLGYGTVSNTLPTTNSTSYSLSFEATHAPYLVGTVGWWPFDGDASDIFGGFDGLLFGNVSFNSNTGMVNEAFFGDGVGTRAVVPPAPALDVGQGRGFTLEGWIRPENITNSAPLVEWDASPTNVVVGSGAASPVPLQKATATFSQTASANFSVANAIDGIVNDNLGWGNQFDPDPGAIAAFQTVTNVGYAGGTELRFTLIQNAVWSDPPDTLGRFRLSVTTDDRSTYCDGLPTGGNVTANWTILQPISFTSQNGALLTLLPDSSILAGGFAPLTDTYTVVARTTLNNITGVRLEMIPDSSLPFGGPGREPLNGNFVLSEIKVQASPVLRGIDAQAQGVQLWTGNALTNTLEPGSVSAAIWDTNSQPHFIETPVYALTNAGWQHVALTYDAATLTARIYTNGQLAVAQVVSTTNFVPRTSGTLYFGYHPGTALNAAAFQGGLDEFGLYDRALSDCEVAAIFRAQAGGKYGTNVLSCPVSGVLQLATSLGTTIVPFTNGLFWPNGPQWETNAVSFPNLLQVAYTNGPVTNLTGVTLTAVDPNLTVDNFVLSAVLTNYINGMLHFNEDTNVALVPIKFAPAPYAVSNFPPTLIFSNEFETATQQLYAVGSTIPGTTNDPAFGPRDWTVIASPVTVVSNSLADATGTNFVALGGGGLQCTLPTVPGHRYQLNYAVRGPGMVSWWNGDVEPLSQRAWDLIGGNNGAFLHQATNSPTGFVQAPRSTNALFFPGLVDVTNQLVSKIEVGDPANLRLTNSFTIEGWIRPTTRTNFQPGQVEQILFRGDSRDCLDPYWLGVERVTKDHLDLVFHVETGTNHDCGVIVATATQPIVAGQWQHIAAVFERNVQWTNNAPWPTNQLRLYVNGRLLRPENQEVFLEDPLLGLVFTDFTSQGPFRDLDPAFSPGVSLGARSRADNTEEFYGFIDELSVYGRALTDPEITALAASGTAGKADFQVSPAQGLAKLAVFLNDVVTDVGYGDNASWTPHTFTFTAQQTNVVLTLQSLEPGTLVDGITLTELPEELNYLPEQSLSVLNGEDGFGVWKLEIWDNRTGGAPTNDLATLLDWQLHFVLLPSNPPPVIHLVHGIPYTNTIAAYGFQNLVVEVPQWATNATNILEFATDRSLTNPMPVGVLWDLTNQVPLSTANAVFWPPVPAGISVLSTNTNSLPYMVPGQAYYLTITNPNPVAVTYGYEVAFDILSLTNCQPLSNFVWQAGIPRYFQFDVPTNAVPPGAPPQEVVFLLTGIQSNYVGLGSNLTVVLSQHLPLPDLTHYDYISGDPSTNNDVVLVTTNTTPFPIQTNRWYVGVFNNAFTNVPFIVQACYTTDTNYPIIIPLTNGVPFVANLTNQFVAPPGPPQWFFFEFQITNYVDAVLFELYNLSGDADLVLQRDTVPGMAPYFSGSFESGRAPEQIVLRTGADTPDLRGNWYLGIFNNESTNVTYTLRAVVQNNQMLPSAQPLQAQLSRMRTPPGGLLFQWNSVVGEAYVVQFSPSLAQPAWADVGLPLRATTILTTYLVPIPPGGFGFYRVVQVPQSYLPQPQLVIQLAANNLLRISWSTNFPGETLQYSTVSPAGPWANVNLPVTIEGAEYVVYDTIGPLPKFYRLIP